MVDVPRQLQSVTRSIRTEDHEGEPSHIQTLEQTYPAPLEDVWEAVTTAERIARWFLPITGELEEGGSYQLQGNAGGTVLECSPPADGAAEYRVTWEFDGNVTWVTIRLAAEGEQTRFELEHISRASDIPEGMWDSFGPGATGVGWDGGLLGLGLHLGATEGSLSPGEAEAWAGTEEGRSFYRGAADGWAVAQVAAGEDPEVAQRKADATYNAYTGAEPEA
ncbi:SRPBCC domain-containing protein [Brachybacterium sp. YJGR34]|uniref:SRPBCC domain-containing protein n=1 Tax=Brachybacterium sp. YJGR34 TaxID=2059911 RepID=UPI000E0B2CD3|nr:SRPBCC domain-containing protein [Brachybacterium sp. YJGR34]